MKIKKLIIFKIRRIISRIVYIYEVLKGDVVVIWIIYRVGNILNDRNVGGINGFIKDMGRRLIDIDIYK